jgi:hypothetical protein
MQISGNLPHIEKIYGIYGKVHLLGIVNPDLLPINTAVHMNSPTNINESFSDPSSFINHWLYGPFFWPPAYFFSVVMLYIVGRLLGRVIIPSQGRYLHAGHHKHRINADRYPFLELDPNRGLLYSRGRKQFMPWTVRATSISRKYSWELWLTPFINLVNQVLFSD